MVVAVTGIALALPPTNERSTMPGMTIWGEASALLETCWKKVLSKVSLTG